MDVVSVYSWEIKRGVIVEEERENLNKRVVIYLPLKKITLKDFYRIGEEKKKNFISLFIVFILIITDELFT